MIIYVCCKRTFLSVLGVSDACFKCFIWVLHMLLWLYTHVSSVCFRCFKLMLQLFHLNVAYIAMAIHTCSKHIHILLWLYTCFKHIFQLFHLFQTYVTNVSLDVSNVDTVLHTFEITSVASEQRPVRASAPTLCGAPRHLLSYPSPPFPSLHLAAVIRVRRGNPTQRVHRRPRRWWPRWADGGALPAWWSRSKLRSRSRRSLRGENEPRTSVRSLVLPLASY